MLKINQKNDIRYNKLTRNQTISSSSQTFKINMFQMFAPPTRAVAAALYRRVEEESDDFSSRLTTHAANNNMSLNRFEYLKIGELFI